MRDPEQSTLAKLCQKWAPNKQAADFGGRLFDQLVSRIGDLFSYLRTVRVAQFGGYSLTFSA